jgi:hypothetical protein
VARYGQAYKDRIVARLLPPESSAIDLVSCEVGISVATLERWRWIRHRQAARAGQQWRGCKPGLIHCLEKPLQTLPRRRLAPLKALDADGRRLRPVPVPERPGKVLDIAGQPKPFLAIEAVLRRLLQDWATPFRAIVARWRRGMTASIPLSARRSRNQ